jgi:hypothetical protein
MKSYILPPSAAAEYRISWMQLPHTANARARLGAGKWLAAERRR